MLPDRPSGGPASAPRAAYSGPGHRSAYLGPQAVYRYQHREHYTPKKHCLSLVCTGVLHDLLRAAHQVNCRPRADARALTNGGY